MGMVNFGIEIAFQYCMGTGILDGSRLKEFFRNGLQKAAVSYNLQLSETTEFYLVNLLADFEKTDRLFKQQDNRFEEEPLAVMLARAVSGDKASQIRELKHLGDTALYLTSFFPDHINRGLVDVGYYYNMGSGAYELLSYHFTNDDTFEELYLDLSENFEKLSHVIGDISFVDCIQTNMDLLRAYEKWSKTHDEKLESVLIKEGLIPINKKISC